MNVCHYIRFILCFKKEELNSLQQKIYIKLNRLTPAHRQMFKFFDIMIICMYVSSFVDFVNDFCQTVLHEIFYIKNNNRITW